MEPNQRRVIRISRRTILITAILIMIAALAWIFVGSMQRGSMRYGYNELPASPGVNSSGVSSMDSSSYPTVAPSPSGDYYKYNNQQPSINDTREFLKVSYSAQVKTRDVSEVVKDVGSAVRNAEGRVDSSHSSDKNGYVSFVVPKSKFNDFRDEIESLTHKKLYTETISSTNLLSQKQTIEQQTASAQNYLATLEKNRKNLDSKHAQTTASLKSQLASVQSQLSAVRQSKSVTQDQNQLSQLQSQEASLIQQEAALRQNQSREDSTYSSQSSSIKSQITQANGNIDNLTKQDIQFTDNVETVSGSVSVQWISLWDMSTKLSPIHPTIIIVVVILIALFILFRTGYIPRFEFE